MTTDFIVYMRENPSLPAGMSLIVSERINYGAGYEIKRAPTSGALGSYLFLFRGSELRPELVYLVDLAIFV